MKLALVSNVNVDYIGQSLKSKYDIAPAVGFGDVWGQLLNPVSSVNTFAPNVIAIVVELRALLAGAVTLNECAQIIEEWKATFASAHRDDVVYLISDAVYANTYALDNDDIDDIGIEALWGQCVADITYSSSNVHRLNLSGVARTLGYDNYFSDKMWYMGSIPYSKAALEAIADKIDETIITISRTPKKVLVLDMDNTLWGGILGEAGVEGIKLAESKVGAIYRDAQRIIKSMAAKGVMLAICSKNNESDTDKVWAHPHMVLQPDNFVSMKINWEDKAANIRQMAQELNVGLDSMVFVDDMPFERESVSTQLPQVTVPEFPEKKEEIPAFFMQIYNEHFKKTNTTGEDLNKTAQYKENAKRADYAKGMDYEDYLKGLQLTGKRVEMTDSVVERMVQLMGKTNQFNLTTRRHDLVTFRKMVEEGCIPFAYNITDKFGDYGLVVVALVKPDMANKSAVIDTLLMSCRVMGKKVEDYVIDDIEKELVSRGIETVYGEYIPTAKNMPVEHFYEDRSYSLESEKDGTKRYALKLADKPKRVYFVN